MKKENKWTLQIIAFCLVVFALPVTLETFSLISLKTSYLIILMGVVFFPLVCCELDENNKNLWIFRNKRKFTK